MSIPSYRLINPQANRCYVFKWEPFGLTTPWHYHPELELIYFVKGKTTGVIGEGFVAKRGIIFNKKTVRKVAPALSAMHKMNDIRKLVHLLDVLTTLSEQKNYEYLTPKDYSYEHTFDEERMLSINEYVYKHFKEPISITDIARVASMTETSFCRYFKNRTLKTFVRFLNEVRISYASRLLNNDNCSITDACFESGFNSLSYFNRQFKAIMRMSPLQYKKWKNYATN